jgi:hypothetical protein
MRVDEVQYTVLADITAGHANRGPLEMETLKVLYKYFATQLHSLVNQHNRLTSLPNSFFALSSTKNTDFMKMFLTYFKREAAQFIEHMDRDPPDRPNFKFHLVYSFVKSSLIR